MPRPRLKQLYLSHDAAVHATYLRIGRKQRVAKTIKLAPNILYDTDARGRIIGMEFLWVVQ